MGSTRPRGSLRRKPAPVAESIEPLVRLKKIAAGTNEISTIATFPQGDGPENGLVIDSEGNPYGTGNGVDCVSFYTDTKVSDRGVNELKRVLPRTEIVR